MAEERVPDENFEPTIDLPSDDSRKNIRLRFTNTGGATSSGSGWLGTGPSVHGTGAPKFEIAVLAGGCASASVDVIIYPIDTLKTRMQASQGFAAAGGYNGLFRGVLAAGLGAVPGGAIFFGSYEYSRAFLQDDYGLRGKPAWMLDAMAASLAATASCLIRTPAIVVQQRMQVGQFTTLPAAVRGVALEGGVSAFYSGLGVSIAREIPFAFIQFPVYEALKRAWSSRRTKEPLSPTEVAVCGSIAGSLAAAATTPLDLLKTRQMLGATPDGLLAETRRIIAVEGWYGLFHGVGPRVGWAAESLEPSAEMVASRRLSGHAAYRSWCRESVAGRGRDAPHRRVHGPTTPLTQ